MFVLLCSLLSAVVPASRSQQLSPGGLGSPQIGDHYNDGRIPRQPGCYCLRTSLHNHLCREGVEFVIKVKILSSRVNPGEREALRGYQVRVLDIFHLPPEDTLTKGSKLAIYTPAEADFCGATLPSRGTYLLAGRTFNNNFFVTSCDYSRKWSTITSSMEKTLLQLPNRKHCRCRTYGCDGELCGDADDSAVFNVFETSKCAVRRDTLQERCYEDHGMCRFSGSGCSWKNKRKPKTCMRVSRRYRAVDST